jgi:hypothetical protein
MTPETIITIFDVPLLDGRWQIYENSTAGVTGTPIVHERPPSLKDADALVRELAQSKPGSTFGVAILTDKADLAGYGLWEYRVIDGAVSRFVYGAAHNLSSASRVGVA